LSPAVPDCANPSTAKPLASRQKIHPATKRRIRVSSLIRLNSIPQPATPKNRPNSHVKAPHRQNPTGKPNNLAKIKHLQAKNKSIQSGILVLFNSLK
jgi:hypothetical protein